MGFSAILEIDSWTVVTTYGKGDKIRLIESRFKEIQRTISKYKKTTKGRTFEGKLSLKSDALKDTLKTKFWLEM